MQRNTILPGDAWHLAKELPDESIHCIVTSPPYFGLRDYGADGQFGLEATPDAYVDKLVALFDELRRALREWTAIDVVCPFCGGIHCPADCLPPGYSRVIERIEENDL